jgi:hypothetical protein
MPDSTTSPRRFPPPWTVEDKNAYFIVRDHTGQALAYVDVEDKRTGAKPLTRDEARRVAASQAARSSRSAPSGRQEKWITDIANRVRRAA